MRYRLDLGDTIEDLDPSGDGGPRSLVPYSTEFTTAKLAAATSQGSFPTPGVAFQDGFAYLAENAFTHGTLQVYDVRDPALPEEVRDGGAADREPARGPRREASATGGGHHRSGALGALEPARLRHLASRRLRSG